MSISSTRLLQFSRQFGKFYAHQFAPLLARTGLSMREVHVLLFLANNPSCDTARDVTELRGLSKSQVSQAVEFLAAEGLLRRTPDGADRRIVHLALTDTGVPLARECQNIQAACAGRLLDGLSPAETAQFYALLETVLHNGALLAEEASI